MPELTVPDALLPAALYGGRRILAKGTPTDQYILNNYHCCHLNVKDKKIYLFTATTSDVGEKVSGYKLDWSQTFWAQSKWAPFYKAMIIPPYKYLIGETGQFLFDNSMEMKKILGKKTEGWNLGYQCMAGIGAGILDLNAVRNRLGSIFMASKPYTVSSN